MNLNLLPGLCLLWVKIPRRGNLNAVVWEHKKVQPLWVIMWLFLKKLAFELPRDPAIPLLGTYPREVKTRLQKMYVKVHSSITLSQQVETTQKPVSR